MFALLALPRGRVSPRRMIAAARSADGTARVVPLVRPERAEEERAFDGKAVEA